MQVTPKPVKQIIVSHNTIYMYVVIPEVFMKQMIKQKGLNQQNNYKN